MKNKYTQQVQLPEVNEEGEAIVVPVAILGRITVKKRNRTVDEVLVQWVVII